MHKNPAHHVPPERQRGRLPARRRHETRARVPRPVSGGAAAVREGIARRTCACLAFFAQRQQTLVARLQLAGVCFQASGTDFPIGLGGLFLSPFSDCLEADVARFGLSLVQL